MTASADDSVPPRSSGWRDIIRFAPRDRDHLAGIRVALAVAAPSFVLWLTDRADLVLFAVFGAFTSVYARNHAHPARMRLQFVAGLGQLSSLALGSVIGFLDQRALVLVPVAGAWAGLWSIIGGRCRWVPPGPMFQVFALGAAASMPMTGSLMLAGMLVALGTVLWCLLIGFGERLLWMPASRRERNPYRDEVVGPPPAHGLWGSAAVFCVVTLIAGIVPTLWGGGYPYWSMVAAIAVVLVPTPRARVVRALHRMIGTLAGIGLGWAIVLLHPTTLETLLIVAVMQFVTELFVMRNYAVASLFITPMVLLMSTLSHAHDIDELAWERWIETLFGCVVGVLATVVVAYVSRRSSSRSGEQATSQSA